MNNIIEGVDYKVLENGIIVHLTEKSYNSMLEDMQKVWGMLLSIPE